MRLWLQQLASYDHPCDHSYDHSLPSSLTVTRTGHHFTHHDALGHVLLVPRLAHAYAGNEQNPWHQGPWRKFGWAAGGVRGNRGCSRRRWHRGARPPCVIPSCQRTLPPGLRPAQSGVTCSFMITCHVTALVRTEVSKANHRVNGASSAWDTHKLPCWKECCSHETREEVI